MGVSVSAAGLFLRLTPYRKHKPYHDGSVNIYQQNAEQKTQTHLRPTEAERRARLWENLCVFYNVLSTEETSLVKCPKICGLF